MSCMGVGRGGLIISPTRLVGCHLSHTLNCGWERQHGQHERIALQGWRSHWERGHMASTGLHGVKPGACCHSHTQLSRAEMVQSAAPASRSCSPRPVPATPPFVHSLQHEKGGNLTTPTAQGPMLPYCLQWPCTTCGYKQGIFRASCHWLPF